MSISLAAQIKATASAALARLVRRCRLCGGSGERVVTAAGGAHRIIGCNLCGGTGEAH